MVYSGAKRTSQLASYMNGDFGGGSRKAGLPYQIGRTAAISYAFRQTYQNLIILSGGKYRLKYDLHVAIQNLADKQTIVDEAQTIYDNAEEGSEAQTIALTSLNLAKSERDAAQTVKDNAQTAYDNVVA
jgi:hypothetical protein